MDYWEWIEDEGRKDEAEHQRSRRMRYMVFDESNLERIDGQEGTQDTQAEVPTEEVEGPANDTGVGDRQDV